MFTPTTSILQLGMMLGTILATFCSAIELHHGNRNLDDRETLTCDREGVRTQMIERERIYAV